MNRHPIKTLRSLIDMEAESCCLTAEETKLLIKQWKDLFQMANHPGAASGEELSADEYGMDI